MGKNLRYRYSFEVSTLVRYCMNEKASPFLILFNLPFLQHLYFSFIVI